MPAHYLRRWSARFAFPQVPTRESIRGLVSGSAQLLRVSHAGPAREPGVNAEVQRSSRRSLPSRITIAARPTGMAGPFK